MRSSDQETFPSEILGIICRRARTKSSAAGGVDACAREYAEANGIELTEFLPEYEKYGHSAPLRRNITIVQHSDLVLAFWDGHSRGTKFVINKCKELGVPVRVFRPKAEK